MSLQRLIVIMALAAPAMLGAAQHAAAQRPDRTAEPAFATALWAAAHRDLSAAAALSALRRLVRIAIPAERHGALSANALLVGARLTRIFLSLLYVLVPSIYFARHIFLG